MRYFPFLRAKRYELKAVRELAGQIANSGRIIPIFEPVNSNSTTRAALREFIEQSMRFLFICNPQHGTLADAPGELFESVIAPDLGDYPNWIPALYVRASTTRNELDAFTERYNQYRLAIIYDGRPGGIEVQSKIDAADIEHHVFMPDRVGAEYIHSLPVDRRVLIRDPFRRRVRNAEYLDQQEFFTDLNTRAGNSDNVDFGDFSIVGDHFPTNGRRAHAVALHHVHFGDNSYSLQISHFISDRTETPVDIPGKVIEAVNHLVNALDHLPPNDTQASNEYRAMRRNQQSSSLGEMKRLAIQHHLETVLHPNGLVP